jgi:hypothetical protein
MSKSGAPFVIKSSCGSQLTGGHSNYLYLIACSLHSCPSSPAFRSVSTLAFLVISVCSYGLFGAKELHADILQNFTVSALSPFVWTRLAQAGELRLPWWAECFHESGK